MLTPNKSFNRFFYFALAISLAITGLLVFVAHHFIAKYW